MSQKSNVVKAWILIVGSLLLGACQQETTTTNAPEKSTTPPAQTEPPTTIQPVNQFTLAVEITGTGNVTSASTTGNVTCSTSCSASLDAGNSLILNASPETGFIFSGWDGACTGLDTTCTLTMNSDQTAKATFAASTVPQYGLTLIVSGTGTVTSNPTGIGCPGDCAELYTSGASVILTATPGANQQFSGWSNACTGTQTTCTLSMTAQRTVTATFAPIQRALNVSVNGTGTVTSNPTGINCGTACTANYNHGTSVTLTATPGANQQFSGWSNACTGTQITCTLPMTALSTVTATFAPIQRALNVSVSGTGTVTSNPTGINCGTACIANYNHGTSVTLTATPGANQQFSGWLNACAGTSTTCQLLMTQAFSSTATFTPIQNTLSVLTVAVVGSGSVISSPVGINCGTTCTQAFNQGTVVSLTPAASTNFLFSGWSGACSGAGSCNVTMTNAQSVVATFKAAPPSAGGNTPTVLYTDALSGSITGGEFNQGAYLSIFGSNFGAASGLGTTTKVYIGGTEVGNYRYLGPAKNGSEFGVQQLTVQVGSLGNPTLGQPLPINVVVGSTSSNNNFTFTPNPGRILFVALNGNDTTAVANNVSMPWRHLQNADRSGAYAALRAGDHLIIRGGNWTDIGFETAWLRFRDPTQMGSAPTGASGTGWIHITAYPGPINGNAIEDVHYSTPANSKGGIHGPGSAYYGTTGEWVSISNLRMDVNAAATSDAAPINLQYSGGHWRVVNNELGPWPSTNAAPNNSKGAGVSGHGDDVKVLGNHIYGMACTGALENHGVYIDSGGSNWEVAFNYIHDITGGNLLQIFDNVGLAGNNYVGFPTGWAGFTGMQIHNNWFQASGKYGLNLAGGIVSGAIWNNVVVGAQYAGLRIDTISQNIDMTIAFNTFYDNDRLQSGSGNAQVLNTWGAYNPTGTIRISNNIFAAGPNTLKSSSFYANVGAADTYINFTHNLYWDNSYGWGGFTLDATAVLGDPKFSMPGGPGGGDLSLQSTSVAIDKATQLLPFVIFDDFTGRLLRPQGAANDMGAYERAN